MEFDAWFEEEGKLIFDIEIKALREVLPILSKPWLEVGVGSGRFAQALGIEIGIDPSVKLLEMAQGRGITVLRAKGEERYFNEETFGAVFLIMTLCFVDSPWEWYCEKAHGASFTSQRKWKDTISISTPHSTAIRI